MPLKPQPKQTGAIHALHCTCVFVIEKVPKITLQKKGLQSLPFEIGIENIIIIEI